MSGGGFVSRAAAADIDALAALAGTCHSHPWTPGQIAEEIARGGPGAVLVVRVSGAELAGGIAASCTYRVAAGEMEILDVAVHPRCRRRGLGRLLVRLALARGRRQEAGVARLEVRAGNAGALALYSSLGFRVAGVRRGYYHQPVEDALLMERALDLRDC